MSEKIIGATVGTSMRPQALVEQTGLGDQVEQNMQELAQVKSDLDQKQPKGNYALKSEIPTDYAKENHSHSQYLTEVPSGYAKTSEIPTKTSQLTNDSGFITSIPSEYVTDAELKDALNEKQPKGDYALKSEIPTKTSGLTNDSGFLTSVPSEYVTETELNAKGYLTQHQDLSGYAKKTDIPAVPVKSVNGMTGDVVIDAITEADKAQIVADVLDSIVIQYPDAHVIYGDIDANNVITLYGALAEETYTVKYEKEDGTLIDIGNLSLVEEVEIVNQIPISQNANGSLFVGTNGEKGYKTGFRLSSSSGAESSQTGSEVTGFIPVKLNDDVYVKNIVDDGSRNICIYDSTHTKIAASTVKNAFPSVDLLDGSVQTFKVIGGNFASTADVMTNAAFMRFSATEITDNSIITVNQPIE